MAAFFVAQYVVNNPDLYREYQAAQGRRSLSMAANSSRLMLPLKRWKARRQVRKR